MFSCWSKVKNLVSEKISFKVLYIKIYIILEQNKQTKLRKGKFTNLDKN